MQPAAPQFLQPEKFGPQTGLERSLGLAAVLRSVMPEPRARERVGRFEVDACLGRGSMGSVYRAHDPQLGRDVAIKVTRDASEGTAHEAVLREAKALALAAHPNVVSVYEIGWQDGEVYVVMELVEGQRFDKWVRRSAPGATVLLDACIQAGRGLAAAHAVGIVHCDFKPQNVMVGTDGRVRVGDFGEAYSRADAEMPPTRGYTPCYAAPEVLAGEVATAASDQYAYCRSMLEMVEGCAIASLLRPVLERGCATEPAQRWPSMDALLANIVACSAS